MSLATGPVVKGDETNAAIAMLANLDIEGAIITGDVLQCNRKMAQTIIDDGADYVLPIKGNQDSLLSDARAKSGRPRNRRPPRRTMRITAGSGRAKPSWSLPAIWASITSSPT
jgi:hypothetical protein